MQSTKGEFPENGNLQRHLLSMIEASEDAIICQSLEWKIIYWNTGAQKLFGYESQELIGKPIESFAPEYSMEQHKFLEKFQKEEKAYSFEANWLKKDGSVKKLTLNISPIFNEKQQLSGYLSLIKNTSAQINFEAKLNEYKYFFNNTYDLTCIANVEGYFEILNPNWEKKLGWSEKELREKQFLEFIHPDDIDSTLAEISKLKTGSTTINFVNRYRKKDGSYLWLDWNSTPNPETGKLYAIARDITEKKKAEDELKRSELFLNSIIENIPNMIFVKDAKDLKFVRFNKAGEELLGFPASDLIGKNDYDFFPEKEADFFTEKDKNVLNSGELLLIPEEPIHTKFKGERILETKKIPIKDNNGNPAYLLGISNDITEQKKIRAELVKKTEELLRSNKELEQFAYVASHDLQEPLRTITNFATLLMEKFAENPDEESKRYLNFVVGAAMRLQQLIKDLLDFSRIGINNSSAPVDCNLIIKQVLADMQKSIHESNARIHTPPLPVIIGNDIELKQLFQNLISNAIKFQDKNTVPEIHISCVDNKNEYIFSVKDNGIGIEKQYNNKIFTIFQRLHSVAEYPGTGIGLATCKKIVDLHNGKIWVESKPGKGSTFHFSISK